MKAIVVAIAFALLSSGPSLAKEPTDQKALEHEIRRMENERRDAILRNDTKALDRMLAPEFTAIATLTGDRVTTRDEQLAVNSDGTRKVQAWDASDVTVRVYGNVGVVTGLADAIDVLKGESRHIRFRYTHLWVKRDGGWQLVHRHTTRVATIKGPAPPQ